MATQVSAMYCTFRAQCFALVELLDTVDLAGETKAISSQAQAVLDSAEAIAPRVSPEELRKIAGDGLRAAQKLAALSAGAPELQALAEEFSDTMETLAESADPDTAIAIEQAHREALRGESVPLAELPD